MLDAEALRSLASMDAWWEGDRRAAVLTPHAGEFSRLRAGQRGRARRRRRPDRRRRRARVAAAKDAAAAWRQVVVLKGARTVIAAPDGEVVVAPFENPALATGGTGDVLAGAIGSLLAQGLAPFAAARLGVYLHGPAGEASASGSVTPACSPRTCPMAWPSPGGGWRRSPSGGRSGKRLGFRVAGAAPAEDPTPAPADRRRRRRRA